MGNKVELVIQANEKKAKPYYRSKEFQPTKAVNFVSGYYYGPEDARKFHSENELGNIFPEGTQTFPLGFPLEESQRISKILLHNIQDAIRRGYKPEQNAIQQLGLIQQTIVNLYGHEFDGLFTQE